MKNEQPQSIQISTWEVFFKGVPFFADRKGSDMYMCVCIYISDIVGLEDGI